MKVFFKEIRAGDVDAVRSRLDANPQLVATTASAPPKKDDGQSPLQVAIKSGHFDIAHVLINRGADVNFVDTSQLNRWNMPVLHDAIRAAIFSTRYGRNRAALPSDPPRIEIMNTEAQFNTAFGLLERLLESGADVNKLDSAGNPALMRAVLDAKQVFSAPPLDELMQDLTRVFSALLLSGADPQWVDPRTNQSLGEAIAELRLRDLLQVR